jgi:hypothetical protein
VHIGDGVYWGESLKCFWARVVYDTLLLSHRSSESTETLLIRFNGVHHHHFQLGFGKSRAPRITSISTRSNLSYSPAIQVCI